MQITINGIPRYSFKLPINQIFKIRDLSALHYDATCRNSSQLGGFIYGWCNKASCEIKGVSSTYVSCTPNELGILLKILELNGTPGLNKDEALTKLTQELHNAAHCSIIVSRAWTASIGE